MTNTSPAPSAVAASIVKAGRSFVSARDAAATASADYAAAAILTADAIRSGVTAKSVSEALAAAVKGDRSLSREVQTSIAYVTMLARTGRILSMSGDMPRMLPRKGETAATADVMSPRDVYTLVRRAQQSKGGAAAVDAATETDTMMSAVDAIRGFIARAERKASAPSAPADDAGKDEAAAGADDAGTADALTPEPTADALMRDAAASVEAAATAGLTGDALALALALADRLADILDGYSADDITSARATLAA